MMWIILILSIGLRLVNLNQSFWLDETAQAVMSAKPLSFIWFGRAGDFQPPLFYFMAHYWLLFSHNEMWLRTLPVFFGVLAVGVVYKTWGKWAGFLLAINPYHIYYSQEFRMYSLLCLLGVCSMILFVRRNKWLFVINSLLLYTHYSSVFLIAAQVIYSLIWEKSRLKFLACQSVLSFLLFLPWLPQFIQQLTTGTRVDELLPGWRNVLTINPLKAVPLIIFKFVAGRINMIPKLTYGIYIAFVLSITLISLIISKGNKLLWIWLGTPIILSLILSFWLPQTQPFRLIYSLPALIILLASACKKHPKLLGTMFIYIAITGNILYFTRERLQREQWRQALDFLQKQDAQIMVRFSDKWVPFYWYTPNLQVVTQPSTSKILLVEYLGELTDPDDRIRNLLLTSGYKNTMTYNFEGVGFINEYTK